MLFQTGVLKIFLLKLQQADNFPLNIAKRLRTAFFHETAQVVSSENFVNFPEKHQWRKRNRFIFLINTTESDSMYLINSS